MIHADPTHAGPADAGPMQADSLHAGAIRAQYSTIMPQPPARLYAYLSNPANERHWQSSCIDAELLGAAPAPGCRYRIAFSFLGRRMAFTGEITALEPEREYAFRVVEGPVHYEGRYSLRPHPGGTELVAAARGGR